MISSPRSPSAAGPAQPGLVCCGDCCRPYFAVRILPSVVCHTETLLGRSVLTGHAGRLGGGVLWVPRLDRGLYAGWGHGMRCAGSCGSSRGVMPKHRKMLWYIYAVGAARRQDECRVGCDGRRLKMSSSRRLGPTYSMLSLPAMLGSGTAKVNLSLPCHRCLMVSSTRASRPVATMTLKRR